MKKSFLTALLLPSALLLMPTGLLAQETAPTEPPQAPQPLPTKKIISLRQAQESAARTNMDFRNLNELIYQADMSIYQAWSMLLPNLSAEGSIIRNQNEVEVALPMGEGAPPLEITIQDLWSKTFGFGANLTLFNPQSIPLIKLAYDAMDAERVQAQINRNDLLFAVTAAYYQAYSMKEMIAVAKENLAMSEEFLRHANALHEVGQGTKIDVNRGEIQVLNAKKDVDDAIDAERKALTALKYLIHEESDFDIEGPEAVTMTDGNLDSLMQDAVAKRLELKNAAIQKHMATLSRKETLTKFLPKFDVTYSWSWASAEGFTGSNINWMLIFGAKWQLFQGGYRIAEYKSRQSQERVMDNQIEKITRDLKQDVETKWVEVEQQKRNLEVADKQVALSEDNHRLISKQFQAGIISSLDLVNAANELSNTKLLRVLKHLQFDLSVLTLKKAAGEYNSLAFED